MQLLLEKTRATVHVGAEVTTKTYRHPATAAAEISWYQRVPWAAPKLIDADPQRGVLVIATHPVAQHHPDYRPVDELAELLYTLEAEGVSHRDVHPGNLVITPDGPRLIDWECGISQPGYDLCGPDVSGVPVPDIHTALTSGYAMYWSAPHKMSIRNQWGADLPARPKG